MPPAAGLRELAVGLFWGPLLLLLAVFWMCASYLPLLVTDVPLALSGKAVVMPEQYLGPGSRCRFQAVVVTACELEVRARAPDGTWQGRSIAYAHFLGRPGEVADMRILGLPAEPYWLTVDAALDRVLNRLLLLLFLVTAALVLAFRFARGIIDDARMPRRMRAALSGQVLTPVMLCFPAPAAGGFLAWRFRRPGFRLPGAQAGASIPWRNPRGSALFRLGQSAPRPPWIVLGVTTPGSGVAMPLDLALSWLGLTEAERQALRAAAGVPEEPGPTPARPIT